MKKHSIKKYLGILTLSGALLFTNQGIAQEKKKNQFIQGGGLDVSVASEYLSGKAGFRVVNHPVIQNYLDIHTRFGTFYELSNTRIKEKDVSELGLGWVSPSINNKYLGANTEVSAYTYPNSERNWDLWDLETGANIFTKDLPFKVNLYGAANFAKNQPSGILKLSVGKTFELEKVLEKLGDAKLSLEGYTAYSFEYYSKYSGFSHAALRCEISKGIGKNSEVYTAAVVQKRLNSFGGRINNDAMGIIGLRFKF